MNFFQLYKTFRFVWYCFFLIFFLSWDSLDSVSTEGQENFWIQEGEILLESKRFKEAEDLANSILESNPSDIKAEFLLTRAWIGLGLEEKKKENFQLAKQYFEMAFEKWPLNENLREELSELKTTQGRRKRQRL